MKATVSHIGECAKLALLLSALFLMGCATRRDTQESAIVFAYPDEAKGMKSLGRVHGSSSLTGVAKKTGYSNALNELCSEAGKLGATHVVLDDDSMSHYWTWANEANGEAYAATGKHKPYSEYTYNDKQQREHFTRRTGSFNTAIPKTTEEKLKELSELRERGIITESEYQDGRKSAINSK